MKQTPIQKAIDKLTETHGMIISTSRYAEGFAEGLSGALEELKQLLPYEEETIKQAYVDGWNDRGNDDGDYSKHTDSDDYFNQTFKK